MTKLTWVIFLHIYQPPGWDPTIIRRVVKESYRPVIDILKRHPSVRITLNINASLTEQLASQGFDDVIANLTELSRSGQVVLTGSAKYHAILPLLPSHEVDRQTDLNTTRNKELFGTSYGPEGFFPPELCVSVPLAEQLHTQGFRWMMADEISYTGTIGDVRFDRKYHLRSVGMPVVFRHRGISDLFFSDHLKSAKDFFQIVGHDPRIGDTLITAFDGENLGHHRPGLDTMWEEIVTDKRIEAITVTEFLKRTKQVEEFVLRPGSWSSNVREIDDGIPYVLWQHPENPIHQRQWELTRIAIDAVHGVPDIDPTIRSALDEALASDQYWWASAQPWWSREIILRGTDRFLTILDNVPGLSDDARKRATELRNEIRNITRDWQKSGRMEKIRSAYLAGNSRPRYLGGTRVS